MRRAFLCFSALAMGTWAVAAESWMGIYLQGQKVGYAGSEESDAILNGQKVRKTKTATVMKAQMLGSDLDLTILGESWQTIDGQLLKMISTLTSGGRTQRFTATRQGQSFQVELNNNGTKTKKNLTIPAGARVVDDSTNDALSLLQGAARSRDVFVLDPVTVSLVKNTVRRARAARVKVGKNEYLATVVEVVDPRVTTVVYLKPDGDVLKVVGAIGMEMIPEPKATALKIDRDANVNVDLGESASVRLEQPILNSAQTTRAEYLVQGINLERVPSGSHQTVTREGKAWVITVHPPKAKATPISELRGAPSAFSQPSMLIPSDSPDMIQLARRVVGDAKTVDVAAERVQNFVNGKIRSNTGIGVLRDATEVLSSSEGLCRDHAVLCATLLRAAKIPTRLASGLVYENNALYYHAWVEVWDGVQWVGYDSTRPANRISAAHVKLGEGNVEEAFLFVVLNKASVTVRSVSYDDK